MARSTKPPSAARVKLAVRMRRGGSTWRSIGFEVGCAAETVRQWPRVYPEEWQAAVRADAARVAGAATSEVVGSLRMMLNDDRTMVRLRAARSLIDLEMARTTGRDGGQGGRVFGDRMVEIDTCVTSGAIPCRTQGLRGTLLATRGVEAEFGATGAAERGLNAK